MVERNPRLWTTLIFRHPRHFTIGKVDKWLLNSADCAIDVAIYELSDKDIHSLVHSLSDQVYRFRTLDLRIETGDFMTFILSALAMKQGSSRPAPRLETLSIDYIDWDRDSHTDDYHLSALQLGFFPCPQLRVLVLPALQIPPAHSKIFANINHLILSEHTSMFPGVNRMLKILKHTPRISKFTYGGTDEFSYERISSFEIVSTPMLSTVNLTAPGSALDVLRRLDAPSLINVRLDGWREYGFYVDWSEALFDCMHDAFASLSERSRRIQRIELYAINMREDDYRRLFRDFPDLESLRFILSDITDEAFVGATCPTLMHLEFQRCEHITVEGVLGFLEGRSIISGGPFELSISGCHKISPGDLHSFPPFVSWTPPSQLPQQRWSHTTVSP
jgi:hypothetical protein